MSIWRAAEDGDLGDMQQLVGHDPGLLDVKSANGSTPLMYASLSGHVGVVRWLLNKGAAINELSNEGMTPLYHACYKNHLPVVRLLLERGADPTLTGCKEHGCTPLLISSREGHVEVVRWLLGHPTAKAAISHPDLVGETALSYACHFGRAGVVRALLESGADPTIATRGGLTPMALAKRDEAYPEGVTAADRRECVAALEVRIDILIPHFGTSSLDQLADALGVLLGVVAGCGAGLPAV
jgi:ankyrin repeat protein